jgi:hypothetical protein
MRPGLCVASDRRLLMFNMVGALVVYVFLVAEFPMKSFEHHKWLGAVVLTAVAVPGALTESRVMRKNSWLAVSRIPAKGRAGRANARDDSD